MATDSELNFAWEGDEYINKSWNHFGWRCVELTWYRRMLPALSQTRYSRFVKRRARDYNDWQAATRDQLILIMRREGIEPFDSRRALSLSATFFLAPVVSSNGWGHARTIHPATTTDLKNLVWALEDAMQGALYSNDRCIYEYSAIKKVAAERDAVWLRVEGQ